MDREAYVKTMKDLLSRDPARIRAANRVLYGHTVTGDGGLDPYVVTVPTREADLVLAEIAQD